MNDRGGFRALRLAAVAAVILICCTPFAGMASASADTPSPAVTGFTADRCPGDTTFDPSDAGAPVPDLMSVFGQRLADYNAGKVVVLYDSWGGQGDDSYPPLCGVRYVEGVGPVSQWMFCTDIHSAVCGTTEADGTLVDIDGKPVSGLTALTKNVRLDPDHERMIARLITYGHSYAGFGSGSTYRWDGVSEATAEGTGTDATAQRDALQTLIWCISDPPSAADTGSEADRYTTCQESFKVDTLDDLLAASSQPAIVRLRFDDATQARVGSPAALTVTTNHYGGPIAVSTSGVPTDLTLCGGYPATFESGVLTLDASVVTTPSDVRLCATSEVPGSVTVSASAGPVSTEYLSWNQGSGVNSENKPCQVFATFNAPESITLADTATATFVAPAVQEPESPEPLLPDTGGDPAASLIFGIALVLAGGVIAALRRRHALR